MRHRRIALMGLMLVGALAGWRSGWFVPSSDTAVAPSVARTLPPGAPASSQSRPLETNPLLRGLLAAIESIQIESDAGKREKMLETLVREMATGDIPAALTFLEGNDATGSDLGLRLIRHWTESDPRAAADWIRRMPAGPAREDAFRNVAIAWVDRNLSEAVAWVRQLPEDDRQVGLMAVAYEAGRSAPLEALKLATELALGDDRAELISHTAREWAATAPQAAADWASKIEDCALRERALTGIATTWSESDPVAAAALALDQLPPGRAQEDAVVGIVQRWVQQDPERAASWVAEFPAGALRDAAMENLVKLWTDRDPIQTANWLNGLGPGPGRDLALEAYVGKIAPSFPESAARWAQSIGDDALRHRQLETVGEDWLQIDLPAAQAWIAQAPLSETAKARLLGSRAD